MDSNPIQQRIEHDAEVQRAEQDALIDAAGMAVTAYGLYRARQESQAHHAWVDSLPPAQRHAYHARQSEVRSHGAVMLLIGIVVLAVGIIGGHSLPGNGAVFNLVGIGLIFVGSARVFYGRG